jgi:hypothetical protein
MPSDIEIRTDKVALPVPKFKEGASMALALCIKKTREFAKANSVALECCDPEGIASTDRQGQGRQGQEGSGRLAEGCRSSVQEVIDGRKDIADAFTDAATAASKLVGPVGGLVDELGELQSVLPRSAVDGGPRDVAEKLKTAHCEAASLKVKLGKAAQSATGLPNAPTI